MNNEQAMDWHTMDDESFSKFYEMYIVHKNEQSESNDFEIEEDLPF
jgi:hypothetical protein